MALAQDIQGQLVLAQFATTFDELQGTAGDQLSMVEFSRLTELSADSDEATALVPEAMTSSDTNITIVEASKAAEISWRARETAFGDVIGAARLETARVIAARVDSKLKAAAETAAASQTHTASAGISYAEILTALAPFGDAIANGAISLVVHSAQLRQLLQTTEFTRGTNGGPGYVGDIDGSIPVYVSDRITTIEGTPDTYRALIFREKPLALAYKKEPEVNTADDILQRSTVVAATLYYAVGIMRPERVAALVTQ